MKVGRLTGYFEESKTRSARRAHSFHEGSLKHIVPHGDKHQYKDKDTQRTADGLTTVRDTPLNYT